MQDGQGGCAAGPGRYGTKIPSWDTCKNTLPKQAGVAQLVEYLLPKQDAAGSSPVARSKISAEQFLFEQVGLTIEIN